MTHALPPLPYAYDALEPHIDARTMEIHYSKHHQAYVNNLNASLQGTPYADMPLQELIAQVESLPPELRMSVRNNGGGHANHSLFWQVMTPRARSAPEGALARAIDRDLGGLDAFKDAFTKAALSRFGSGWAWLCVTPEGVLTVESSANQDNPAMHGIGSGHVPILGLDVWEHAYYLLYQNRRPDYIAAFYNVVDWDEVARRHALAAPQ
ncbi:superoxide dismutase [Diaphorobacter ruginosibacter]|uniref:superoxide dismutase n=1 Tax=Diaphorobacter ruginosibacter TaxID=1715720 RepID=UPI001CB6D2A0|nr:superoxide dismutase [Diaphorobacter ruginosibacter]